MLNLRIPAQERRGLGEELGMSPAERMMLDRARERAMGEWRRQTADMEKLAERAMELLKVADDPTRSMGDRVAAMRGAREYQGNMEGQWERLEHRSRLSAHQVLEGAALGIGIMAITRFKRSLDKDLKLPDSVLELKESLERVAGDLQHEIDGARRDRDPARERDYDRGMVAPAPGF